MQISREKIDLWKNRFENIGELFPKRITIELTSDCNLNCIMCPRNQMDYPLGFMDFELFKKIIDEISQKDLDTKLVLFFRGESLLHPKFKQMLSYAVDAGLKDLSLATNASLMDENLADHILDAGIKFISFSIDASSEAEYTKQRVNADFNTVMKNIRYFLKKKDDLGLELPTTQVSLVETEVTKDDVEAFITLWKPLVDRVRIYKQHSQKDGFGSGVETDALFETRLACPKTMEDIVFYWDGNAAICNHDWNRKSVIANVKTESIENIYNSEAYQTLRKKHLANDLSDVLPCNNCEYWQTFYLKQGMFGRLIENENK